MIMNIQEQKKQAYFKKTLKWKKTQYSFFNDLFI